MHAVSNLYSFACTYECILLLVVVWWVGQRYSNSYLYGYCRLFRSNSARLYNYPMSMVESQIDVSNKWQIVLGAENYYKSLCF